MSKQILVLDLDFRLTPKHHGIANCQNQKKNKPGNDSYTLDLYMSSVSLGFR